MKIEDILKEEIKTKAPDGFTQDLMQMIEIENTINVKSKFSLLGRLQKRLILGLAAIIVLLGFFVKSNAEFSIFSKLEYLSTAFNFSTSFSKSHDPASSMNPVFLIVIVSIISYLLIDLYFLKRSRSFYTK